MPEYWHAFEQNEHRYIAYIDVEEKKLQLILESLVVEDSYWACSYTASGIEEITHGTKHKASFDDFCVMLHNALRSDRDSHVFVRLLTADDIQNLAASHPDASTSITPKSGIMYFCVRLDDQIGGAKIEATYSLRLERLEAPTNAALSKTIRRLRQENMNLQDRVTSQQANVVASRQRSEQELSAARREAELLKQSQQSEVTSLRTKLYTIESELRGREEELEAKDQYIASLIREKEKLSKRVAASRVKSSPRPSGAERERASSRVSASRHRSPSPVPRHSAERARSRRESPRLSRRGSNSSIGSGWSSASRASSTGRREASPRRRPTPTRVTPTSRASHTSSRGRAPSPTEHRRPTSRPTSARSSRSTSPRFDPSAYVKERQAKLENQRRRAATKRRSELAGGQSAARPAHLPPRERRNSARAQPLARKASAERLPSSRPKVSSRRSSRDSASRRGGQVRSSRPESRVTGGSKARPDKSRVSLSELDLSHIDDVEELDAQIEQLQRLLSDARDMK
ncbi:hypothetical protein J8273_8837 [Carpediemonas membranifera]|uniref:Coiled-coil domain-containing protein 61 n=1 Tax=Carpediemonas membranifera TaxID=201153 RepID=A0A8J6DX82_9EUKA|nr:hypothetical protein J8273_8837 [Carpediemonas membranifera]|eukprot:KAG9389544.1 hypothetical protein J8273_8837 [Carpediemonas membranifera]